MGGFGMGELILLLLFVLVAIIVLRGMDRFRGLSGRTRNESLEERVLQELELLSLRLDVVVRRLDDAGIPSVEGHSTLSGSPRGIPPDRESYGESP